MKKAYVLVYADSLGSREAIKNWANGSNLILTWRHDLPSSIYLVSEGTAAEIHADLVKTLGRRGRFLIVEISENRQGILPAETWYLFRRKRLKSKL